MLTTERKRTYALFAIVVVSCALGSLSQTAVNAMVDAIGTDLGIGVSVAQWFTTAYMLVLGITIPMVTYLSRRFSMRTLVLTALGFMLVGSVVAALARGFVLLLTGRVLQAMSTGIMMPLLQTIAMTRFSVNRRSSAMGVAGIALGFAPNIGPSVGGVLVGSWGWQSFFVLLAVLAIVLFAMAVLLIERNDAPDRSAQLDVVSLMLSTIGFGGLLLAFSNASNLSPASPLVWVPLVVGVACLVGFVRRQRRLDDPLVNMGIFQSRRYRFGFWALNLLFGSFMGITLIVPLYVMGLCGGTALQSGSVFLPATAVSFVCNPLAGVLSDKVGTRPVVITASVFLVAGSVSMIWIDADTPLALVSVFQAVRAAGVSSLIGPLSSWGLSKLPGDLVVHGSAFSTSVRQVCASLGTAVMVLLLTVGASVGVSASFGYMLAFGLSALLAVGVAAIAVARVRE